MEVAFCLGVGVEYLSWGEGLVKVKERQGFGFGLSCG